MKDNFKVINYIKNNSDNIFLLDSGLIPSRRYAISDISFGQMFDTLNGITNQIKLKNQLMKLGDEINFSVLREVIVENENKNNSWKNTQEILKLIFKKSLSEKLEGKSFEIMYWFFEEMVDKFEIYFNEREDSYENFLKKNVKKINDQFYNSLENMVFNLKDNLFYNKSLFKRPVNSYKPNLRTDEKLVALALYYSLNGKKVFQ